MIGLYEVEREWIIREVEMKEGFDPEQYLEYDDMIRRVARQEWKGSHIFDRTDIEQAVWLHVLEHYEKDYAPHSLEDDPKLIYWILQRAARTWCKNQRIEYMYATGSFLYTPQYVREQLVISFFVHIDEASDLDARMDLERAWATIQPKQRQAITKKLRDGWRLTKDEASAESKGIRGMCTYLNDRLGLIPISLEELQDTYQEED